MAAITSLFSNESVFGPADVQAMSMAFDEVCKALQLDGDERAKETIARRIIELARRGERHAIKLRDQVLAEANGETRL